MNSVRLDTKELDRIAKQLNLKRDDIVRRFAFQVEGEAKQNAPKDTTALENSIYTVTNKQDGYQAASAAATAKNKYTTTQAHPKPSGNVIANVGPCVDYAAYVELGTSKRAANPYLGPAVEHVADKYNSGSEWKELVE